MKFDANERKSGYTPATSWRANPRAQTSHAFCVALIAFVAVLDIAMLHPLQGWKVLADIALVFPCSIWVIAALSLLELNSGPMQKADTAPDGTRSGAGAEVEMPVQRAGPRMVQPDPGPLET